MSLGRTLANAQAAQAAAAAQRAAQEQIDRRSLHPQPGPVSQNAPPPGQPMSLPPTNLGGVNSPQRSYTPNPFARQMAEVGALRQLPSAPSNPSPSGPNGFNPRLGNAGPIKPPGPSMNTQPVPQNMPWMGY